jgi:hypothetical protein
VSGAKTVFESNTNEISNKHFEDEVKIKFQDSKEHSRESSQVDYSSNESQEYRLQNNNSVGSGFTTGDGEYIFF